MQLSIAQHQQRANGKRAISLLPFVPSSGGVYVPLLIVVMCLDAHQAVPVSKVRFSSYPTERSIMHGSSTFWAEF